MIIIVSVKNAILCKKINQKYFFHTITSTIIFYFTVKLVIKIFSKKQMVTCTHIHGSTQTLDLRSYQ